MMTSLIYSFLLFIILVLLPIICLLIYFRDLIFGPATPARIKREIKPNPNDIIDFINSSESSINIVAGEMDPAGYTSEVFDALKTAWKRGVKISVIAGPIILYDPKVFPIMAKLVQERIVNFYVSLKRQPHHFYVDGGGKLFFEEKHEPITQEKTLVVFRVNKFETQWYRKKFSNILKSGNIEKFSPDNGVLLIERDQLNILKKKVYASNKKFDGYTREDFKNLMDKENIKYFLWSNLCQSLDT